jgi:hypothetical protein
LQLDKRYRGTVEPPREVEGIRRVIGILLRPGGKAVLVGEAAAARPDLGLLEADVPEGQAAADALAAAALAQAGATLGRVWLMFNIHFTPLGEGDDYYHGIYLAEVEGLAEAIPDQRFTRRAVLVRDLMAAIRRRHYELAEPLVMAIDRYSNYRALEDREAKQSMEATSG